MSTLDAEPLDAVDARSVLPDALPDVLLEVEADVREDLDGTLAGIVVAGSDIQICEPCRCSRE